MKKKEEEEGRYYEEGREIMKKENMKKGKDMTKTKNGNTKTMRKKDEKKTRILFHSAQRKLSYQRKSIMINLLLCIKKKHPTCFIRGKKYIK